MADPGKETLVQNQIEQLLKLQIIDYDLGELERSKEYLPDMMENLNREIQESQARYEGTAQGLEDAKVKQQTLELEIASKEAELQKYQQQMMSIKTNKEYDALVAEIDSVKNEISTKETELLETIELITTLEKNAVEFKEKLDQVTENNTKQLEILQQKIDSIGDTTSVKRGERKEVASMIPRPIMSSYERVRKGKGGSAVVAIKHRACGACYKALTPKKIQDIRKAESILTCDNCGRLLYWDDNESN
ncbi:MAG: C4-type zinc ribbon domain-containing protein [Candidatus Zixiibacteriota bacterium]